MKQQSFNLIPLNKLTQATKDNVTVAKMTMLLQHPFFACLLLDMLHIKYTKDIPTCGVDTRNIYINPDFFDSLTKDERVFIICHEVGHAMWMHMHRAKEYIDLSYKGSKFEPFVWNMAGDYIINDMLVFSKVGSMPKNALLNPTKYNYKMTVEEVYDDLMKNAKFLNINIGNDDESGGFDKHYHDAAENTAEATEWERAIKSAMDAAKQQGKMPGGMEDYITDFFEPVIDWRDKIKAQVRKVVGVEQADWSRPNRRKIIYPGIYLPRRKGYSLDHVVIAMDTSGSVSHESARKFYGEAAALFSEFRPVQLTLIYCDAEVQEVRELFDPAELDSADPQPFKGRGGTSFTPPFKYLEDNEITPDILIYMTDLYGDFPIDAPPYSVMWLTVGSEEAPFGEVIKLEAQE